MEVVMWSCDQEAHVDPVEAVQMHLDLRSRRSLAIHWVSATAISILLTEPLPEGLMT